MAKVGWVNCMDLIIAQLAELAELAVLVRSESVELAAPIPKCAGRKLYTC